MRFCFSLLHHQHRTVLRADNMDHDPGPLGFSGRKNDSFSTVPCIVSMCITACDRMIIPMMMSRQCIGPTRNTISLARRKHAEILGLLPLTAGRSKWDRAILENWAEIIHDSPELGWELGLIDGIPQSRSIVKADLGSGNFRASALPAMEKIFPALGL